MRRIDLWFWIPYIAGSLLRLAWVWTQPLWYDENFTLAVLRLPYQDMLTAIQGDVHPPLFYLLYKPLVALDLAPWAYRLPSVLLGVLCLPVAWRVFGLLASRKVKQIAFVLYAIAATGSIYYAQEFRMYALLQLLLLLAVLALLTSRWTWLAFFSILLLFTQNYALFYLPALWLAGILRCPQDWKPITLAMLIAAFAYAPWINILLEQQANLASGYWIPPFTFGVALIDLYHAIIQKGTFRMDLFGLVVIFGWMSYAFWWHMLKSWRKNLPLAVIAFAPWLLAIAGSLYLGTSLMHYRSLVPLAPFILLWMTIPLLNESTDEKTTDNPYLPTPDARGFFRTLPLS